MKVRQKFSSYVLFMIILIVCAFNQETTFAQKYFPLQIGNRWFYERKIISPEGFYTKDTSIVSVINDTIMTNGKLYYNYGWTYYRVDSNWIYQYKPHITSGIDDWNWYKLDAKVNEEWNVNNKVFLRLSKKDSLIYFGIKTEVLEIVEDALMSHTKSFSDRFGIIKDYFPGEPPGVSCAEELNLIGCVINGVTYGQLVSVKAEHGKPDNFIVYQNTPNPFASSTTISWQQNQTSVTKVIIYNALGQKVRMLFNDQIDAGKHPVVWDGINDSGQPLRSGMYFYEIIQGSNRVVKQMVMIK